MCLVFEVMEAVTTSLMTTSAIAYAAEMGTTETLATIQGVIQGSYYGMGESITHNIVSRKGWQMSANHNGS